MSEQEKRGLSRMLRENRANLGYFGGLFGALGVGLGFLLYESGDLRLALGVLLAASLVSMLSLGLILVERNKGAAE